MKYPKLSAAIDDLLSKLVREKGEDAVEMLLTLAAGFGEPVTGPPKQVDIPVESVEAMEARQRARLNGEIDGD